MRGTANNRRLPRGRRTGGYGRLLLILFCLTGCQRPKSEFSDNTQQAEALIDKGHDAWKQADYDAALEHFDKAARLYEQSNAPGLKAEVLRKQSAIYRTLADYSKAAEKLKAASHLYQRTSGTDSLPYARVVRDLGDTLQRMSEIDQALAMYQIAL